MLIEKSRLKTILSLSVPIVATMFGYNLIGLIDIAMVGRLGDAALASMGIGNFIFILLLTLPLGIGSGVQALVARRIGEGNPHLTGHDLNIGLLIACSLSLVLMIICYSILPFLFPLVSQDPEVIEKGVLYLGARIPSLALIGAGICFRSFWNGISLPIWPLVVLGISLIMNVIFNYLLIFGNLGFPRLETMGAGLASTLAAVCGATTNFILGLKYARKNGFLQRLPDAERIRTLLRVSLPESANQFFIILGVLVFFAIVGLLGTKEMAASNVLINIFLIVHLPIMGFGIASLTLVSQALGRKESRDAKKWGWEVASIGTAGVIVFSIIVILFPQAVLSIFISDQSTINLALIPLQLLGLWIWIDVFGTIISFSLIGAGATKVVLICKFLFWWGLDLPLRWLVGVHLEYGLEGIFLIPFFVTTMGSSLFSLIWYRERWALIKI